MELVIISMEKEFQHELKDDHFYTLTMNNAKASRNGSQFLVTVISYSCIHIISRGITERIYLFYNIC